MHTIIFWIIFSFVLILYVPVKIFSVMSGRVFLGLTTTTPEVRLELATRTSNPSIPSVTIYQLSPCTPHTHSYTCTFRLFWGDCVIANFRETHDSLIMEVLFEYNIQYIVIGSARQSARQSGSQSVLLFVTQTPPSFFFTITINAVLS